MSKNSIHTTTSPLALLMASASAAHDYVDIDILGETVPFRPVTILESVGLVKEFSSLYALFEKKLDASGMPLPDEQQPNLISIFVDAGKEAIAAFVAFAVDGDAAFKKWFMAAPDKVTLEMFKEAAKVTLGEGDLDAFFMKVMIALAEAKIIVLMPPAKPEPAQPASEAA